LGLGSVLPGLFFDFDKACASSSLVAAPKTRLKNPFFCAEIHRKLTHCTIAL
jgi:hypothetical protein